MKLEDHENRSVEVLGNKFTDINIYLDQYFPLFRSALHRCVLHHKRGVDLIVNLYADSYGYEGRILVRQAANLHIMDDMDYIADDWKGMEENMFFLCGDEREFDLLIHEIFN